MAVGNTNPLPQWQEPAVDKEGRWKPNWYKWVKPLLGRVDETKQRVDTVESDVTSVTTRVTNNETDITGLDSAITTETTNRINADATLDGDIAAVSSTVTTLSTTVNNNTTSITQNTSSINGLHAQWAVEVNVNEHVVGLVRLDGGASGSTFRVVSDNFIVQHPTISGEFKQAFQVGLRNGVSTLVLNGDMIVDGSVTADSLNVTTLSAVTANAGTITAGVLQSADGKFVIDLDNKEITIET
jgi:hypothetical protein